MFSLESPHRGDSIEYTQHNIINIKKKITLNYLKYTKGYSIKTYHPGGDPTLKLAKPPLEVQLSVYRPTLEPCSFNTYPPLEEIFISFRMVLVVCIMYVCMYVCTHLFKLTPNMCLLKKSLLKYFYRIFFFVFFFVFFLLFFWAGGGGCVRGAS